MHIYLLYRSDAEFMTAVLAEYIEQSKTATSKELEVAQDLLNYLKEEVTNDRR